VGEKIFNETKLRLISMKKNHEKHGNKKNMILIFVLLAVAVIGVIAIFIMLMPSGPFECDTEYCFAERANACKPTLFWNQVENATIQYEITDQCVMIKTVIDFPPTEEPEIREAFLGKNMSCYYEQDGFLIDHVETLKGVFEDCQGELKAIIEYLEST